MPRLIDAVELIEVAHRERLDSRERIERMIESAPTVDAEPVRHGRWQKERNPMRYQVVPYVFVCDQCGTAFEYDTPYCGECGAKMDEVKDG